MTAPDYTELRERWTCFHCGETFTTPGSARDHFGFDQSCDPACIIKIGAERGLVMALRKAEADCDELRHLLHDEASEAYRLYAAQTTRHRAQLMATEEAGYEKGLADGRSEASTAIAELQAQVEAMRDGQASAALAQLQADNAALRDALETSAIRLAHLAGQIEASFNISGTLRAEQAMKGRHMSDEARAALQPKDQSNG